VAWSISRSSSFAPQHCLEGSSNQNRSLARVSLGGRAYAKCRNAFRGRLPLRLPIGPGDERFRLANGTITLVIEEKIARGVGPARLDIAYADRGDTADPPVLLLMGLGGQLVAWRADWFCQFSRP